MEFNKDFLVKAGLVLLGFGVLSMVVLVFVYPLFMGGVADVAQQRMAERFSGACQSFCAKDVLNSTILMVYGDLNFHLYSCKCAWDFDSDKGYLRHFWGFSDMGLVKDNMKSVVVHLDYSNCTANGWTCAEKNLDGKSFISLNSTGGGFSTGGVI